MRTMFFTLLTVLSLAGSAVAQQQVVASPEFAALLTTKHGVFQKKCTDAGFVGCDGVVKDVMTAFEEVYTDCLGRRQPADACEKQASEATDLFFMVYQPEYSMCMTKAADVCQNQADDKARVAAKLKPRKGKATTTTTATGKTVKRTILYSKATPPAWADELKALLDKDGLTVAQIAPYTIAQEKTMVYLKSSRAIDWPKLKETSASLFVTEETWQMMPESEPDDVRIIVGSLRAVRAAEPPPSVAPPPATVTPPPAVSQTTTVNVTPEPQPQVQPPPAVIAADPREQDPLYLEARERAYWLGVTGVRFDCGGRWHYSPMDRELTPLAGCNPSIGANLDYPEWGFTVFGGPVLHTAYLRSEQHTLDYPVGAGLQLSVDAFWFTPVRWNWALGEGKVAVGGGATAYALSSGIHFDRFPSLSATERGFAGVSAGPRLRVDLASWLSLTAGGDLVTAGIKVEKVNKGPYKDRTVLPAGSVLSDVMVGFLIRLPNVWVTEKLYERSKKEKEDAERARRFASIPPPAPVAPATPAPR